MKDFHVFVSEMPHANIDLCFVAMWFALCSTSVVSDNQPADEQLHNGY